MGCSWVKPLLGLQWPIQLHRMPLVLCSEGKIEREEEWKNAKKSWVANIQPRNWLTWFHDSNKSQIVFMHNFFAPKPMPTPAQTAISPVDTNSTEVPVEGLDLQSIAEAASYESDKTEDLMSLKMLITVRVWPRQARWIRLKHQVLDCLAQLHLSSDTNWMCHALNNRQASRTWEKKS